MLKWFLKRIRLRRSRERSLSQNNPQNQGVDGHLVLESGSNQRCPLSPIIHLPIPAELTLEDSRNLKALAKFYVEDLERETQLLLLRRRLSLSLPKHLPTTCQALTLQKYQTLLRRVSWTRHHLHQPKCLEAARKTTDVSLPLFSADEPGHRLWRL
jgi:hypothetical protein